MATQTLNLGNFGQAGFLPDIAPSLLPQTGFSYSRNWRFKKGGHAEVTEGYTNVFDTRGVDGDPFLLGEETTKLSFLYTWELADDNALVVYDRLNGRLTMTENAGDGDLSEYVISTENRYVLEQFRYQEDDTTPGEDEYSIDSSGALYLGFTDAAAATAAAGNILMGRRLGIVDTNKNKLFGNKDYTVVADAVATGDVVKVVLNTPLDASKAVEVVYTHFQFCTYYDHDSLGSHKWDGTDALGIPVFNNEVEPPWEFKDAVFPYVEKLDNWPNDATCKQLTSFGSVLVAVGFEDEDGDEGYEGGTRVLAFSNPITDAGTLPTWTFSDLDSEAQLIDLSLYTDGALVSAFESQGRLIVNSTTDVMSITDNGDGTYSATKLEIGGGVLSKRASVPISNGFFCIGNGQFYIHDTNTYQSIGHGQYSASWFSSVDEERLDEIQVIYDPRTRTVWIKTPTSEVAQQIWIIDLENNYTLSVLDGHDDIEFMEWSAEGTPAESLSWDTMPVDEWDEIQQNSWNEFPIVELGDYRNRILSVGGRACFVHDYGPTYDGTEINAILEKSYFKLAAGNSHETFQFSRLVPWVQGETGDELSIRVGSANSLGNPVTNTDYKTYTIGTTEKLDFRRTAKWGSITFVSNTSGTKVSGVEIEVNTGQRR